MADDFPVRQAVDIAWAVFLATHSDVDAADERRCLLERHMQRTWAAREDNIEELACSGVAYLSRLPADRW
jgi:hypothetical protein